jgi:hypothetical protein
MNAGKEVKLESHLSAPDYVRAKLRPLLDTLEDRPAQLAHWKDGSVCFFSGNPAKLTEVADPHQWFRAPLLAAGQESYRNAVLDQVRDALCDVLQRVEKGHAEYAATCSDLAFVATRAALISVHKKSTAPKGLCNWYREVCGINEFRNIDDPASWLKDATPQIHMSRMTYKKSNSRVGPALTITHSRPVQRVLASNRVWGIFTARNNFRLEDGPATALDLRPHAICWNESVLEWHVSGVLDQLRGGSAKVAMKAMRKA